MEAAAISKEVERLELELEDLQARVEQDNSSFSALERQVAALRQRLTDTHDALRTREGELAQRRAELAKAQRLERLQAYQGDVEKLSATRTRVEAAASKLLGEIQTYDAEVVKLRKLRGEMQEAFGEAEGVSEVDAAMRAEADKLISTWKSVAGAVGPRTDVVDTEAEKKEDLAADLKKRTEDTGRASRILELFNKG